MHSGSVPSPHSPFPYSRQPALLSPKRTKQRPIIACYYSSEIGLARATKTKIKTPRAPSTKPHTTYDIRGMILHPYRCSSLSAHVGVIACLAQAQRCPLLWPLVLGNSNLPRERFLSRGRTLVFRLLHCRRLLGVFRARLLFPIPQRRD